MAYKRTNRRRYRKRSYRKGKAPLSKRQYSAVKTLALKQINYGREKLIRYQNVNEFEIPLQTGTKFINDTNGNQCLNLVPQSDEGGTRNGMSLTAKRFNFKGHIKINGGAAGINNRTAVVRIIFGFTKAPLSETDVALMYKGGYSCAVPDNITASYLNLNLAKFFPFSDKTFHLTPATQWQDSAGTTIQTLNGTDMRFINVSYNFGKKGCNMKYNDNTLSYANEKNIACLVISRNANDDQTTSILKLEMSGVASFTFTDS